MEKAPGTQVRQSSVLVMDASKYTQLEQAVQEMRADTLQILRTPYFHNCKATRTIRQVLRQVGELCKQMRAETVLLAKQKRPSECGTSTAGVPGDDSNKRPKNDVGSTSERILSPQPSVSKREEKLEATAPQETRFTGSTVEPTLSPQPSVSKSEGNAKETPAQENRPLSPIVGGSPAGMNFIMFPNQTRNKGISAS
ncbi:hypothetical protein O6H91_03G063200 [Diphasiastrum complanatum]|uniref:Uncharacterized protein n=1 Tax=Diphasiastrum complanatum TaxID=34168 RepID=A0ACC2E6U1_DIPCM|nr:hypothetical protein O6H91_03G063200 [Diphasiastrum complanatum]